MINENTNAPASLAELQSTGDWAADNATGRAWAERFLNEMWDRRDFSPRLGFVMEAVVASGRFSGIEVGFLQRIEVAAWTSRHEAA